MSTKKSPTGSASAQPYLHQREIQAYGTVNHALPLDLKEPVRLKITEQLNQLLADTMTIRDLYNIRSLTGRSRAPLSTSCPCSSTSTSASKSSWWTASPRGFSFSAEAVSRWRLMLLRPRGSRRPRPGAEEVPS